MTGPESDDARVPQPADPAAVADVINAFTPLSGLDAPPRILAPVNDLTSGDPTKITRRFEKPGSDLLVLVVSSTDIMVGWANAPGFTGKRVANMVSFTITDDMINVDYAMVERIPGVGDMGFFGTATGTVNNGKIVATFNGEYRIGYGTAPPQACQASDHLIEITPAGS